MGRYRKNSVKSVNDEKHGVGVPEAELAEARVELNDLRKKSSAAVKGKRIVEVCISSDSEGVIGDIAEGVEGSLSDEEVSTTVLPVNAFGAGMKSGTSYYRCNITTAVRELKGIQLSPQHYELLESTPFYGFTRAIKDLDSNLLTRVLKKDDKGIRCVMSRYHQPTGMFILGGKSMRPAKRDVELTFAVVGGKTVIPLTKGDAQQIKPQWLVRCFKGCDRKPKWKLTKKVVLDKLLELCPKDDPTSVADVVRLLHCYMLACVFAPKQNTSVSQHLASYIEDISKSKSYDWAGYVLKALLSQLKNTINMKSGGCTMLLLFWLCEHVALIQPSSLPRMQFPRCLRWDLRDLYLTLEKKGLAGLLEGMVNHEKLQLTAMEINYFKANLRQPKLLHSAPRQKRNLLSFMRNSRSSGSGHKCLSSKRKKALLKKKMSNKALMGNQPELNIEECGQRFTEEGTHQMDGCGKNDTPIPLRRERIPAPAPRALKELASPNTGGIQVSRFKVRIRLPRKRQIVSDSDSESEAGIKCSDVADGYETPPPSCGPYNTNSVGVLPTPRTSDFMDILDADGVPRGGVRATPYPSDDVPCCNLFDDEPADYRDSRLTNLESENSRLLLLVQEGEEKLADIRARAQVQCQKHREELTALKGLASKMKIALSEMKDAYEAIIQRVSSECLALAQEINKLKAVISKLSAEKNQLSHNETLYVTEKEQLIGQLQKLTLDNKQLQGEKAQLRNQMLVLEDQLAETSSAGKAYVFDMEKKFDDMALLYAEQKGQSRSQLNEERAWGIRKDKRIDELGAQLHERDLVIRNLRSQLGVANAKVQQLKEVPPTVIYEHPDTVAHIECVELLVDASKVITEMGAEIDDADRTIVEQAAHIERMQLVPLPSENEEGAVVVVGATIDTTGSVSEVGESSNNALCQPRKRNRLTVSPGSITRAIKQRTRFHRRVPRKLSNEWEVVSPVALNYNVEVQNVIVPAAAPVALPVAVPVFAPFPILDHKWPAVRFLKPENLVVLKEIWAEKGPRAEVIHSGPYGLGVVHTERCVGLLHHESINECMVDGFVDTLRGIFCEQPGMASVHIFPARLFGVINTKPHPEHLKQWVDDALASAIACEIMLFPMNAPACLSSTAASGSHWTLLRYNVKRNEWCFYNSLPQPDATLADVHVTQSKKIVAYVENAMKKLLRETNPEHGVFAVGSADREPLVVDTCKQEVGSVDCGIVVCNQIELIIRKKPVKKGAYTKAIAGAYRAKMVEWFLDPDSARC